MLTVTPIVDVDPDEAVLFKIKEGENDFTLELDEKVIEEIFSEYTKLYEEQSNTDNDEE